MYKHVSKFAVLALVLLIANPALGGMVPSKTAENQSLDTREADLAAIDQVVSMEGVSEALAAHGFTKDEIDSRLANLSNEDLRSLSQNLQQIQAAGITTQQWTYVLIGAVVVLLIVLL
ncbi:MAG TPA: PA2779 family protein [Thermoanaerobaculia bacterium]|nr:PA2779 family protein [Thermoanaerobaculia bacterium]